MKTYLKKIISLVLILFIVCFMASCKSDSTTSVVSEVESLTGEKTFVDSNGEAIYRIVRPDKIDAEAGPLSVSIFKKYRDLYGVAPQQVTDAEDDNGIREIVVGDCDRESVRKAKQIFESDSTHRPSDFLICTIDEDIVILGGCERSLLTAGEYFKTNILPKYQEQAIYYHHKSEVNDISLCNISQLSRFKVVRPLYNVSYLTQLETDKLCDLLYEKTGYSVEVCNDSAAVENPDPEACGGLLETTDAVEYEIIIGNCDREGVRKIISQNKYEIRIEGTKIYLNGGSPYATTMAVSEFIKIVENNDVIDEDMSVLNGNYNQVIGNYDSKTYYRRVWWDDFDGTEISTRKWHIMWDARSATSADGKPCYRGSSKLKNNYVENGKLVIAAAKTDDAYYGGMLKTDTTMQYLYGYLEISNIHPKGGGFWTSLWMQSSSNRYNRDMWYSETDVDECMGNGNTIWGNLWAWPTSYGRQQLNLHNGRNDTVRSGGEFSAKDTRGFWMDFHTYGFEWVDNKTMRFTVDGYVWREANIEKEELQTAYSQYMYLQISMACAFDRTGVTEDEWEWENTNKFIVDWIYLYQLEGHGLLQMKK